jgi:hypothetical protein
VYTQEPESRKSRLSRQQDQKKVKNSNKLHLAPSPVISKKKYKTPSITKGLRRSLRIKRSMDGHRKQRLDTM